MFSFNTVKRGISSTIDQQTVNSYHEVLVLIFTEMVKNFDECSETDKKFYFQKEFKLPPLCLHQLRLLRLLRRATHRFMFSITYLNSLNFLGCLIKIFYRDNMVMFLVIVLNLIVSYDENVLSSFIILEFQNKNFLKSFKFELK